jgi:hypothetical protein
LLPPGALLFIKPIQGCSEGEGEAPAEPNISAGREMGRSEG